jgi:hypothetical protein
VIYSVWADFDGTTHYLERFAYGFATWGQVAERATGWGDPSTARLIAKRVTKDDIKADVFRNVDAERRAVRA